MRALWDPYVFRRGGGVGDLWDDLFRERRARILYIAGRGFDLRAQSVLREFVDSQTSADRKIEKAQLLLIELSGYELDQEMQDITAANARELEAAFQPLGSTAVVSVPLDKLEDENFSTSAKLRLQLEAVLRQVPGYTDIVLDVSSLPRVAYLALLTSLLSELVPLTSGAEQPLYAGGVNLQVLVAEDAHLDGNIRAEDPSDELVFIPGFSSGLQSESVSDWPLVWFPILGENRVNQLKKILSSSLIPDHAEICPVLPHPSRDPRRADRLTIEYRESLFDSGRTLTSNILYAHEGHPFEAYRQLLGAMRRYQESLAILGGCRLVVTPLGSKLITLGAALACFEMRPVDPVVRFRVGIPHAEAKRYVTSSKFLKESRPEISALLLTGEAYKRPA